MNLRDLIVIGNVLSSYAYLDKDSWNKILDFIAISSVFEEVELFKEEAFGLLNILTSR